MEFSELYKHTTSFLSVNPFSYNGETFVTIFENKLVLRNVLDLEKKQVISLSFKPTSVKWHKEKLIVLVYSTLSSKINVIDTENNKLIYEYDSGHLGIQNVEFSNFDELEILVFTNPIIQMLVINLSTGRIKSLDSPKHSKRCMSFQNGYNKTLAAIIERTKSKEYLLFITRKWKLLWKIPLDNTIDSYDLVWSNDDLFVVIYELIQCKLIVYSSVGSVVFEYTKNELGFNHIKFSGYEFMICGTNSSKIIIFSTMTWDKIIELDQNHFRFQNSKFSQMYYKEIHHLPWKNQEFTVHSRLFSSLNKFKILENFKDITSNKLNYNKDMLQQSGIKELKLNCDSTLFCTQTYERPNILNLYSIDYERGTIQLITGSVQINNVKVFEFHPSNNKILAYVSENNFIYLFNLNKGFEGFEIATAEFKIIGIKWNLIGNAILAYSKNMYCCAYVSIKELEETDIE